VLGPYIADGISNAWAISGTLTESGKPILANDPHLRLRAPSIWYQMHMVSESDTEPFEAMGVSIPGLPGIAIGRNPWVSWGFVLLSLIFFALEHDDG
jgi:penicillin amidase